jgi:hypothetical protein
VALDMAQWWQPTVGGYLGRVSKALICEAVIEAKGKAADNIATLKKGDMADRAAELVTGTGWLPAMLRAAWLRGGRYRLRPCTEPVIARSGNRAGARPARLTIALVASAPLAIIFVLLPWVAYLAVLDWQSKITEPRDPLRDEWERWEAKRRVGAE